MQGMTGEFTKPPMEAQPGRISPRDLPLHNHTRSAKVQPNRISLSTGTRITELQFVRDQDSELLPEVTVWNVLLTIPTPNFRYLSFQYGMINRYNGGSYSSTIAGNGINGITESGGWVTPYILHRTNPNTMFIGYTNVWRSTNVKAPSTTSITWTKISSDAGGITVLEQSPADINILYVFRGQVKRCDNANASTPAWTTCTVPGGSVLADIKAHPTNPDIVYAAAGTKIYKSTNKGMTWNDISGTLPSVYYNCIVCDKNTNEGIYAGNQTNVYYKDASLSDWVPFSTGLPMVDIRELEIYYDTANPSNNRIKAATYGRGLWQSDLFSVLAVTPANQDVPQSAGSTIFNVTTSTSVSWVASSNSTWCSVTPSGSGNGMITANFTDNPSSSDRVAVITVTPTGALLPRSVTVTQAGMAPPSLIVLPPEQVVTASAGSTSFSVTSNSSWTVVCSELWCTVTSGGSGNGTIQANYSENVSIDQRIAMVTVSVTGLIPVIVTVKQDGIAPELTISPSNQDVPCTAGSITFSVTSNTNWSAVCDSAWCFVTPNGNGNGLIVATYDENPYNNPRIAVILVSADGPPPQTVTVNQAGSSVSIEDHYLSGIKIYPVPTDGKFRVDNPKTFSVQMEVSVIDYTGKNVFSQYCPNSQCSFDLSSLQQGCYFVKIRSEDEFLIRKLVIIRY